MSLCWRNTHDVSNLYSVGENCCSIFQHKRWRKNVLSSFWHRLGHESARAPLCKLLLVRLRFSCQATRIELYAWSRLFSFRLQNCLFFCLFVCLFVMLERVFVTWHKGVSSSATINKPATETKHQNLNCNAIKFRRFENGSNKVAIALRVVHFWSETILVISNRSPLGARSILKSRAWFQTKLHSTKLNYHY